MPIYEYDCDTCRETFSLLQRIGSEKGSSCPKCGSKNVTKKISAFSCSCSGSDFFPSGASSRFTGGG